MSPKPYPQATAAATASLPCQEKLETPSIVKVDFYSSWKYLEISLVSAFIRLLFICVYFTDSHLKVMEEDKKKEVLGNGLATESEPTAVVKVFCNALVSRLNCRASRMVPAP